jgi:hypothetical protein
MLLLKSASYLIWIRVQISFLQSLHFLFQSAPLSTSSHLFTSFLYYVPLPPSSLTLIPCQSPSHLSLPFSLRASPSLILPPSVLSCLYHSFLPLPPLHSSSLSYLSHPPLHISLLLLSSSLPFPPIGGHD